MFIVAHLEGNNGKADVLGYCLALRDKLKEEFGMPFAVKANSKGFYLMSGDVGNYRSKPNAERIKSASQYIRSDAKEHGYASNVSIEQDGLTTPLGAYMREKQVLDAEFYVRRNLTQPEYRSRLTELSDKHGVFILR